MWAEFEWENKVSVQSNINDMNQYLDHILKCTNMRCLTPKQVIYSAELAPRYWYFNVILWQFGAFNGTKLCDEIVLLDGLLPRWLPYSLIL